MNRHGLTCLKGFGPAASLEVECVLEGQVRETRHRCLEMNKTGTIQGHFLKRERWGDDSQRILTSICRRSMQSCPSDGLHFIEETVLSSLQG